MVRHIFFFLRLLVRDEDESEASESPEEAIINEIFPSKAIIVSFYDGGLNHHNHIIIIFIIIIVTNQIKVWEDEGVEWEQRVTLGHVSRESVLR